MRDLCGPADAVFTAPSLCASREGDIKTFSSGSVRHMVREQHKKIRPFFFPPKKMKSVFLRKAELTSSERDDSSQKGLGVSGTWTPEDLR